MATEDQMYMTDLPTEITELFKVVLCGSNGVGKTAIYTRLKEDKFHDTESLTANIDQCAISWTCICNTQIKIHLWDTLGMERFANLTRTHYHNSIIVLVVYSADIKKSLLQAEDYIKDAKTHAPRAAVALVCNKIDLPEQEQVVTEHQVQELFPSKDFKLKFKISAKTGEGIKEMMDCLCKYIHKNHKNKTREKNGHQDESKDSHNISLEREQPPQGHQRRWKCCGRM